MDRAEKMDCRANGLANTWIEPSKPTHQGPFPITTPRAVDFSSVESILASFNVTDDQYHDATEYGPRKGCSPADGFELNL